VDGQPLGEKNPKWLQDDYVKFIRFAQMKMDGFTYFLKAPDGKTIEHSVDGVENGVVGVITNHAWLDNPTFRGMRQSLMATFDQIFVLNLHGNARRKERAPDGGDDQNVFDIEQGVAITLFVKNRAVEDKGVWHAHLWGRRLEKYQSVLEMSKTDLGWEKLDPIKPFYLFVPQDQGAWRAYAEGKSVTEIFAASSVGIATARDKLTIHFQREDLIDVIKDFSVLRPEIAREKYKLGNDVRDWRVAWAQADLVETGLDQSHVVPCLYGHLTNAGPTIRANREASCACPAAKSWDTCFRRTSA
jgi:predicted helicase